MSRQEQIGPGNDCPVHKTFQARTDKRGNKRHGCCVLLYRVGAQRREGQRRTNVRFPVPAGGDAQELADHPVQPIPRGFLHYRVRLYIARFLPSVLRIPLVGESIAAPEYSLMSTRNPGQFGALASVQASVGGQGEYQGSAHRLV